MPVVPLGVVLLLGGVWLLVFGWRARCQASDVATARGPIGVPVGVPVRTPVGVPEGLTRTSDRLRPTWYLLGGGLLTLVGAWMVLAAPHRHLVR